MNEEQIKRAVTLAKSSLESIQKIDFDSYSLERVVECITGLFARSPIKKGDTVKLKETPVINENESWGWLGSKHFLVKGASAKVVEVGFYKGDFVYEVEFDKDSWIYDGKINYRKPEDRNSYSFAEKWLEQT